MRLTLKGLASGISALHLQYSLVGSQPAIYDPIHNLSYYIGEVRDARIAVHPATCADTPTPTPGAAVGGAVTLASQTSAAVPWRTVAISFGGAMAVLATGVWYGRRRWLASHRGPAPRR